MFHLVTGGRQDMPLPDTSATAGYAYSPFGQIHYVEAGSGEPVLLLHQTPRSVDEYRDVVPLLGRSFRAIAMDTLGFGASARPQQAWSIELFASGVLSLMDALGLERAALVGHHTGGVIAMEVAVANPERVSALVLSGTPYVDAERRRLVSGSRPPIDEVAPSTDGSHLTALWQRRMGFYPPQSGDLLTRFVADALKVLDRVEEGHRAVNAYHMEERIGHITVPTLVTCGAQDEFSGPDVGKLVSRINGAVHTFIADTGVAAVDHKPAQFAAVVEAFLTSCLPAQLVSGA
jgi:pimeloyl-ACP methyl ester carboxylesterase